jgi:hypothetical protein
MKLVVYQKVPAHHTNDKPTPAVINNKFGSTFSAMEDGMVESFIASKVRQGFVCYEFDFTAAYHSVQNVVKVA